jgi:glycosyltransferase involved in cell wall biosynthesis
MNQLKVTILLPVYNGTKWIEKSIRSALRQSFSDFELIILNDCSTDDTERVVFSFMSQDKRIVYIRNDKNLGLAKTLNVGLGTAKGEYIARLDADDEWIDVDKLKKQVSLLDKYPEYTLVGTGAVVVDENGQEEEAYGDFVVLDVFFDVLYGGVDGGQVHLVGGDPIVERETRFGSDLRHH